MKLKLDDQGHVVLTDGKPTYIHDDGREIAFDGAQAFGKIGQLTGENTSYKKRFEEAESKLKSFEGIDDPAKARKAMEVVSNLDGKKLIEAGEKDKAIAEAIKSVEEKYAPVVKKAEELEGQLNTHLIGGAFSRSKFIAEKFAAEGPAGVEIAQALFQSRFKVEDGKVVAYDAQGGKIFSRSRHGELADAEEAIEIMVDAYPHKAHILKGTGANGGGAQGGGNGNGKRTLTREQFSALDPIDRAKTARDPNVTITD